MTFNSIFYKIITLFVKKPRNGVIFLRKLLLLLLSLLLITTLTGCGTTKTSATTPDNTPKTAEDKKLMEEIKQHENLTDADMKKIQADAKQKYKEFTKDRAEYKKGYEKTNPNADYYYFGGKK